MPTVITFSRFTHHNCIDATACDCRTRHGIRYAVSVGHQPLMPETPDKARAIEMLERQLRAASSWDRVETWDGDAGVERVIAKSLPQKPMDRIAIVRAELEAF